MTYTIRVEYSDNPGEHYVGVYAESKGGSKCEFHGPGLVKLLNMAMAWISKEERW